MDSIVLEEEIDPNYVPSEDEVVEYAKWLGMDLDQDEDLFWIAREGLMAPLPKDWKPCKTKDTEDIYYFNFSTGESTWDHPCDGYYKKLYEEEKKKKEIRLKEERDQKRSRAKQDVEMLVGKKDKKRKKSLDGSSLLERPSSGGSSGGLPMSLDKKPLPDIRGAPLGPIRAAEPLPSLGGGGGNNTSSSSSMGKSSLLSMSNNNNSSNSSSSNSSTSRSRNKLLSVVEESDQHNLSNIQDRRFFFFPYVVSNKRHFNLDIYI